jgi:hypothetical protein
MKTILTAIFGILAFTATVVVVQFSPASAPEFSLVDENQLSLIVGAQSSEECNSNRCSGGKICNPEVSDLLCSNAPNQINGQAMTNAQRKAACEGRQEVSGANCTPSANNNVDCPSVANPSSLPKCSSAPEDKTGPCGKVTYYKCKYQNLSCIRGATESQPCGNKCLNN